jgi:hypothetical protein
VRRILSCSFSGLAASAVFSTAALAGGTNVADYTLRVHIVQNGNRTHYHDRVMDYVDGEGRGDLYENGQPRGFDYGFRCDDRVRLSPGYETYPARWKKAGRELEILQPVMGKPGAMWACNLKVEMKDMVYIRRNGLVDQEPAAVFKEWMEKRQYDPEHGKNEPTPGAPASGGAATTGADTPDSGATGSAPTGAGTASPQ